MIKKNCLLIFCLLGAATWAAAVMPGIFFTADRCVACHNQLVSRDGADYSFGADWSASMMANSARDPYWQAALRRETLIHPDASEAIQNECAGCHMPMARYLAKADGRPGKVFAHLPVHRGQSDTDILAADGVSCTLCHQIRPDKLGTRESFTAGFVVDHTAPPGDRTIFGPFETDPGRAHLMRSASFYVPEKGPHIQSSEFCASCHTLYTHALSERGEALGTLPEQVPYLEWKQSAYARTRTCQACHMPELAGQERVTGVLGLPRDNVSRHVFRGGNFFISGVFNRHRAELGIKALPQDLERTRNRTLDHLAGAAAKVEILQATVTDGRLVAEIEIRNLAGHKLPTAYPSRRVWLHLTVLDGEDNTVFESGRFKADGAITGNDNDRDRASFEPHYDRITRPDQVQIYEPIMGDVESRVTTVLLSGVRYLKDNRLLPAGFDKETSDPDCGVYGAARDDGDFIESGDRITYEVPVTAGGGPFRIVAELWYQPIGYRWAHNLSDRQAAEIERFIGYYNGAAEHSATILAASTRTAE